MKKVIINGANGKMGQAVARIIKASPQLGLTVIALREAGDKTAEKADVIIDFSTPQGAMESFDLAKEQKAACLIGTTNLPERFLFQMQEEHKIPLFYAPNVSLSVYFFGQLLKKAAQMYAGYDMGLHEIHHAHKKDAPSGTAKRLAEIIGLPQENISYERLGEVPGTHILTLSGPYDKIILKHEALNRDLFAASAVEIAAWLVNQPAGFYTMQDYAAFALKSSKKKDPTV